VPESVDYAVLTRGCYLGSCYNTLLQRSTNGRR
jgi:hypothetical protein